MPVVVQHEWSETVELTRHFYGTFASAFAAQRKHCSTFFEYAGGLVGWTQRVRLADPREANETMLRQYMLEEYNRRRAEEAAQRELIRLV